MKAKTEPPLHLDLNFEEALRRFAQTKPEEVEPPKGRSPKVTKAAKKLPSFYKIAHHEEGNDDKQSK